MAATDEMPVKPPRPPNSWILYRAYMMKKLTPKDPTVPRPSQSEMSSTIAEMWRTAPPEVKREFEERAERLKLEHQIKYPHYKYQPRKKEDKEREKVLQRQQRQANKRDLRSRRGVTSSTPQPPPPIQPNPYLNPHHVLSFSPALSPPVSAANSPLPDLPSLLPPLEPLPSFPPLPTPTPLWQPQPPNDSLEPTMAFAVNNWILDTELASFLSAPSPAMFQVHGFDQSLVDQNPNRPLEVSFQDFAVDQDVSTFLKAAYDKEPIPGPSTSFVPQVPPANDPFDFSAFLNPYPSDLLPFYDPYDLNPVDFSPVDPTFDPIPTPQPLLFSDDHISTSYVPPSGASLSSTRRVAGKWSIPAFISASSQG